MSRRKQRNHTAPAEGEAQVSIRQQTARVWALGGSGLLGASLSCSLMSRSPLWPVVATVGLTVVGAIAQHTPDLVRALVRRMTLRTTLREVRQFAREDLLSAKISPQQLLKLAAEIHRLTLENRPTQSHDDRRDSN
ncbi:hypothetical protein AB0G67_47075 [Streptomyces sp. NPDC021056]|uniref:hypothetical protein n=1 Tax=unclassified Streptomyces TaxID=2593676 RepID=UPI00331A4CA8